MNKTEELLNRLSHHWEEELASVMLNDFHFTDEEKHKGMQRLQKRLDAVDGSQRWRRLALAAAVITLILFSTLTLWYTYIQRTPDTTKQLCLIQPRNLDMVLTTTDGHTLNLSEGGKLTCSDMGYITINGFGQTLTYKPSATEDGPTASTDKLCELHVPEGKRTQLELSDGSRLWVNSATSVWFPIKFNGNERRIIVSGEAYLEVAHKPECPFYVETDRFKVKVLGTKFGVTAYPGKQVARVVLAEGCVEVTQNDNKSYTLVPNQMIILQDGKEKIQDTEAYTYISWKDGLLYFNGTTLSEALSWLSKQYAVDINCSPNSAKLKLYGKLVLEEHIESVLDNLTVIEPITYKVRNNQIFVDKR